VRAHGESGWTGRLIPLTVDGLIYAGSMAMLDSARRDARVPGLARWLLGLGIVATLAANVAHGLGHGIIGAAVAAWPAFALVGSYELLMTMIRGADTGGRLTCMMARPRLMRLESEPRWCSRLTWQLIAFPQCVPSVQNSMLASRAD
jgi:hypothetical protein